MTQTIEDQSKGIQALLKAHPYGLSRGEIAQKMNFSLGNKVLQRRLAIYANLKKYVWKYKNVTQNIKYL